MVAPGRSRPVNYRAGATASKRDGSDSGRDIRLREVVPFEQERLTGFFRKRVDEAVAEIQSGRMPSPSEFQMSHAR